jgi:hypothetical protein
MVVGEWDFAINRNDPEKIMGQNFYMSEEYISRQMYYDIPRNDLEVPGAAAEDYVRGELENWTESALQFDGQERFAVLKHDVATADYPRTVAISYDDKNWLKTVSEPGRKPGENARQGQKDRWKKANDAWQAAEEKEYPGSKRKTVDMGSNNFLLEIYLKPEGSQNSAIISKMLGGTGSELRLLEGQPALMLANGDNKFALRAETGIADGKWHHLLAEVDRQAGIARLYVDGELAAEDDGLFSEDVSLSNTGDFFIGRGEAGPYKGLVDFTRVSRGTLADAETTLEELYAWQFINGPFLKDFTLSERDWKSTPPGALNQ